MEFNEKLGEHTSVIRSGPSLVCTNYFLTVNTQKDFYSMSKLELASFRDWFSHFLGRGKEDFFIENFMFRCHLKLNEETGRRRVNIYDREDEDGNLLPLLIKHFEWSGMEEVGSEKSRYHGHININVVTERVENQVLLIDAEMLRCVFCQIFGYRPHVDVKSSTDISRLHEYYKDKGVADETDETT